MPNWKALSEINMLRFLALKPWSGCTYQKSTHCTPDNPTASADLPELLKSVALVRHKATEDKTLSLFLILLKRTPRFSILWTRIPGKIPLVRCRKSHFWRSLTESCKALGFFSPSLVWEPYTGINSKASAFLSSSSSVHSGLTVITVLKLSRSRITKFGFCRTKWN